MAFDLIIGTSMTGIGMTQRVATLLQDAVNSAADSHASLVMDGVRTALQSVPQHIVHQVQLYIRHVSMLLFSPFYM